MAEVYWPELVDALLVRWRADSALSAANIFDGPARNEVDPSKPAELFVGATGEPGTFGEGDDAGATEQEWANANTVERDSTETVACGLWLYDGAQQLTEARRRVKQMLAAISTSLRASLDLGIAGVFHVELADVRWRQVQTPDGCIVGAVFTIRAQCRIYL